MKLFLPLLLCLTLCFSCNEEKNNTNPEVLNSSSISEKTPAVAVNANSKVSMEISGMMCEIGCVRTIKSHLSKMEGITNVKMDFDTARAVDYAIVEFDSNFIQGNQMKAEIEDIANGIYQVKAFEKMKLK